MTTNEIIPQLCEEVDKTFADKRDNPHLRELAVSIISDPKGLPEKFVSMAGDIHEIDTDCRLAFRNRTHFPRHKGPLGGKTP